jgi:GNAT superfamily N-acetyltransferase
VEDVQLTAVDAASPEAQWAMTQYFAELAARFPEGFDATGALEGAAAAYKQPHGIFLLATNDGETVGCGGLQHIDDETTEVKRMWVAPTMRGHGLATRLLQRLEGEARTAGRATVVLDTHSSLTEAITLYERRGYAATERYNDNPYAKRWFRKSLDAQ